MRLLVVALLCLCSGLAIAQTSADSSILDTDHDGLSDATEAVLLKQFAPHFLISSGDCSAKPAQFTPNQSTPIVLHDNGTIYGQAFLRRNHSGQVELHFYQLWRRDCGELGHGLDTEHVSALLQQTGDGAWKALYWYAAAHEDTACDASQIVRAAALHAETNGPDVWISDGKHADFLSAALCNRGCGGDRCRTTEPLRATNLIDLGELSAPMNGAIWAASPDWPLSVKMGRSDFTDARITRLENLPATDIAWANPDKRPMQAAVLGGNRAIGGAATGFRATNSALDLADADTGDALNRASTSTGNALTKTWHNVVKALHPTVGNKSGSDSAAAPRQ